MELEALKEFFDTLPEGVSIIDSNMRLEWVNKFLDNKGFHCQGVKGKKCYFIYKKRGAMCKHCPTLKVFSRGKAVSVIEKGADGRKYEVTAVPVKKDGKVEKVIEIVREKNGLEFAKCKNIERKLIISEKKYRELEEKTLDIVCHIDSEGIVRHISKRIEEYGISPDLIVGREFDALIRHIIPIDRDKLRIKHEQAKASGMAVTTDFRIMNREGSIFWFEEVGNVQRDSAGNYMGIVATMRDVTARKTIERSLREAELQYRNTLNMLDDAVHVVDSSLKILLFNRRFAEWNRELGLSSNVLGRGIYEVFKFLPKRVFGEYRQVIRTGKPLSTVEESVVGKTRFVTHTKKIPVIEGGKVVRVITVVKDITEQKEAEERLKSEKKWSDAIISLAPNIVVGLGEGSKILIFNKFAERLTGYKASEVIGKKWIETFIPLRLKPQVYRVWGEVMKNRSVQHKFTNPIITKSGKAKVISWSNSYIEEKGRFRLILSIGEDVTEKKPAEKKEAKAKGKKRKAKGRK